MTKLLKETYKTYDGAHKRAGFENGIARSEFQHGYKARLYHYTVVTVDGAWRVQRTLGNAIEEANARHS